MNWKRRCEIMGHWLGRSGLDWGRVLVKCAFGLVGVSRLQVRSKADIYKLLKMSRSHPCVTHVPR
eukprot:2168991-Amphidinium_carterae.1